MRNWPFLVPKSGGSRTRVVYVKYGTFYSGPDRLILQNLTPSTFCLCRGSADCGAQWRNRPFFVNSMMVDFCRSIHSSQNLESIWSPDMYDHLRTPQSRRPDTCRRPRCEQTICEELKRKWRNHPRKARSLKESLLPQPEQLRGCYLRKNWARWSRTNDRRTLIFHSLVRAHY